MRLEGSAPRVIRDGLSDADKSGADTPRSKLSVQWRWWTQLGGRGGDEIGTMRIRGSSSQQPMGGQRNGIYCVSELSPRRVCTFLSRGGIHSAG